MALPLRAPPSAPSAPNSMLRRLFSLATLGLSLGACNPDTAVFVDADLSSAALVLEQSSLSTGVAGTFVLTLHLGPRAGGASEVSLGAFSITDADRATTLVPSLGMTTDPSFPVTVDVDSTIEVTASLAAADNLVEVSAIDALCAPGGVVIVGALDDSLAGGTLDVASAPVQPTGCP
ncbi:MAG: hypothetical protein R3B72_43585 [Polyangiaceae bacterium]